MKRYVWSAWVFLILLQIWQSVPAQTNQELESALRRLAASLRMKTRMVQMKEPMMYFGFRNPGVVNDSLEQEIEKKFILKFAAIVVCDIHEDEVIKRRFDQYTFSDNQIPPDELLSLLNDPEKFPYIIYGTISRNEKDGRIDLKAFIYHSPNNKHYMSVNARLP